MPPMDTYTRLLLALAGQVPMLGARSSICFADSEGGGAGDVGAGGAGGSGTGTQAPKTFTQEEVNGIVAKEVKGVRSKLEAAQAESTKKTAELQAQLEKLTGDLEIATKPDAEKAKLIAEREQAKSRSLLETAAKERDEAKAIAAKAVADLQSFKMDTLLTDALASQKANPETLKQAVLLMKLDGACEFDDQGNLAVTVPTGRMTDLKKAAEHWLKANPHFLPAPAGGAGTKRPNAGGNNGVDMNVMSPSQLIEGAYRGDD